MEKWSWIGERGAANVFIITIYEFPPFELPPLGEGAKTGVERRDGECLAAVLLREHDR
jgi:hypothetical protein